jgi:hypothetical protein
MADAQRLESLLVADIGSVSTKVGFVDRVGGEFRFISAATSLTTAEPPIADVLVGVRRAIELIEERTGRRFISDDGQLITPERGAGQGVDAFVAVTSAAVPLRVALVGISREVSLTSAIRAINGTYATVEATMAIDQFGGRWVPVTRPTEDGDEKKTPTMLQDPAVLAAEALVRANPDVIVLVGGIDGGATMPLYDMANLISAIVSSSDETARPTVIFAGNREARSQVAARIGQAAPFRVVDNVRPTLEFENWTPLQRELEAMYIERKITWLPGLNALTGWMPTAVMPSARALENVVRYIARRFDLNVLGADIGSVSTSIVTAQDDSYSRVVRSDLGIGHNLGRVIARADVARVMDWLPMEMETDDAYVRLLNHTAHPASVPAARDDARLMQAAACVALATAAREANLDLRGVDLLLLSGGAATLNSNLGSLALLALDALQPTGIFTLAVDTLGLAAAFGALAAISAPAAANTIERDGFVTLGTVIAPISNTREGDVDLRVQIKMPDGTPMNLEVQHGSLELIPLPAGQKASIEMRPASGVYLGKKHSGIFKAQVEGGAVGLIVDARGRPIALPADAEKRRAQVQRWYWDIGGEVSYG